MKPEAKSSLYKKVHIEDSIKLEINVLRSGLHSDYVQKAYSYFTENRVCVQYKNQLVNAMQETIAVDCGCHTEHVTILCE
jgi:hypothetical protein